MLFFSKLGGTVVAFAKARAFRRSPFVFCASFRTILKLLDMPEERPERMWFVSGEYESVIIQLSIQAEERNCDELVADRKNEYEQCRFKSLKNV